jgi:hypothetical protein
VLKLGTRPVDKRHHHARDQQHQGRIQRPRRATVHVELAASGTTADNTGHLREARTKVGNKGDKGRGKTELDRAEGLFCCVLCECVFCCVV